MITDGLTKSDLNLIELDLGELKNKRNALQGELKELNNLITKLDNGPTLLSATQNHIIENYLKRYVV